VTGSYTGIVNHIKRHQEGPGPMGDSRLAKLGTVFWNLHGSYHQRTANQVKGAPGLPNSHCLRGQVVWW